MTWPVANTASDEKPSERGNTFARPPGIGASSGCGKSQTSRSSKPLIASLIVPSPPKVMTASNLSARACFAISAACIRYSVNLISKSN